MIYLSRFTSGRRGLEKSRGETSSSGKPATSGQNATQYEEREKEEKVARLQNVSATYFPPCPFLFYPLSYFFSSSLFRSEHRLPASRCFSCVRAVCPACLRRGHRSGVRPEVVETRYNSDPCHPSRHVSRTGWVIPTHATRSPPSSALKLLWFMKANLLFVSPCFFPSFAVFPSFLLFLSSVSRRVRTSVF